MNNKLNFIITGATAAMLLLPVNTSAQGIDLGLPSSAPAPEQAAAQKISPLQRLKMNLAAEEACPLLFKAMLPENGMRSPFRTVHQGGITPLSVEPRVPLRAPQDAFGKELWGGVVSDDTWTDETAAYGFYKFTTAASMSVLPLGINDNIRPNGGGAVIGGKLYFVNYYKSLSGKVHASEYVFSTETWEQEENTVYLSGYSLIATETATSENGTVYGIFFNADATGYELGIADYPNQSRTTIGSVARPYVALGITKANELYGVASDGNLYRINISTAEETLIGPTGISLLDGDGKYYYQGGEIDQQNDRFYWAAVDVNGVSRLYTVNLATGAAELVGEFTNQNSIMLLTVPKTVVEGTPAAATGLSASFPGHDLTGTVSFKLPSESSSGGNLSGNVSYAISEGATTLKTGNGTPGADITEPISFDSDGMKFINVTISNAAGNGPSASISQYVGYDTPKVPANLSFSISEEGDVSLSWDAVTAGENGAYLGEVRYEVVRYPDVKVIAKDITATSCTDKITSSTLTSYSYGVKAYNERMTGKEALSGHKTFGDTFEAPYSESFDDEADFAHFTVIDNNRDESTWTYYKASNGDGNARYMFSADNAADDWLITPPIMVEKDKTYVVKFKARSFLPNLTERIEVRYGRANTVAAMTGTLLPATDLYGGINEFSKEIKADADGKLHIGFHAISEPNRFYLELDDISVSAGMSKIVPDAASGVTVTPAAKGAKEATISFTAPMTAIDGSPLSGKLSFRIMRDGAIIKEISGAAPGSIQSFVDLTPANGFNSYCITSLNADGEGRTTEDFKVYVGIDTPDFPTLSAADNTSSIKLTWTDAETGENGGYVDTSSLSHKFYTLKSSPYGIDPVFEADIPVGTSHYDKAFKTDEGEQNLVQFGVSAVNEVGEGDIAYSPYVIVGKPYTLPFFETVADGKLAYGLWWKVVNQELFKLGLIKTESSDANGGCIAMQSKADGGSGIIGTGKIRLGGAGNPMLIFSHKAEAATNTHIIVSAKKPDGTIEDLKDISVSADGGKWVRESIALKPEYVSLPYIVLQFKGVADKDEAIYMDEIYVRDIRDHDLTLNGLSAPDRIRKGETAKVGITVSNFSGNAAKDFTVKLFAGDKLVDSQQESAALEPFCSRSYSMDFTPSIMSEGGDVTLRAEVDYAPDMNTDDNAKSVTIRFNLPDKPRPGSVTAMQTADGSVRVEWSAVEEETKTVEDGFESYEAWTMDSFGGWTGTVGASLPADAETVGPLPAFGFPNMGKNFAFIVVEPLNYWLTEGVLESNPMLKPHSGDKYIAAFYKGSDERQDICDADNWIVSPLLSGKKQTVSFWATNHNTPDAYYPETFDVLYSNEGTDISKFTKIGDTYTLVDAEWEQIAVELPEGATRFAIHHNTKKETSFMFQIDDVRYEAGSGKVTGYRIYRDGKLLKQVDADNLVFTDETAEGGRTYLYAVTAVFADTESEATIATAVTTGTEALEAVLASPAYDVFTTDGKLVGKGMKSLKTLKSGSYIINDRKVIIR